MPDAADTFDIAAYRAQKAARPLAEKVATALPEIVKALLPYSVEHEDAAIVAVRLEAVAYVTERLALIVRTNGVAL